ncbi:hypothetical protein DP113_34520 (plasmid) [Brasilonema octagenarum UFV-E1]|uniref:MobA/VirD2-like nuclease domain-containing protein n=2 Tax=Brasilonema TaxID=383614 RepID=A0A856MT76_9CYAN|nr:MULTISPECIES: relaxase/mobilization nuclease domain-containing protein [Brasilonema]NMF63255.1 hypothetical protein [Brasilonema octagenarum UFV-OR1]QDL12827.1 hypothetical protein DP114_34415 [Brasilonema sennae CENA114]QDL19223.1 hypothetical protein DP113_34520 [Brasilonema octagenarum UFV-E1]
MIPVIYKKPNFLDTLKYVLEKDDAAIVDTNMMGTSPHQFNEQFLSTKYTNKAVKRQCAHLIIAIAHRRDYHEHLSDSQYSYVAREYLKDMGYLPAYESPHATSQFVAVRHHDRDHEHLHIIASRIRLDGSLVNDSYDYFNSQVSTRRIAAQLGLEVTPTTNEAVASRLEQEYGITALTSRNRSKSIRAVNSKHKTPTSKEIIRSAIGEAIIDSPTISTFIQRLEENNIGVLPKMRGDELLGFTYIHNDVKIAGYQVYKPYSWNKLQSEYGLTFDQQRDVSKLQQAKTNAISRINNNIFSKIEYNTIDKPTSDSTGDSGGATDDSSNFGISTNIRKNSYTDERLTITPILESKLAPVSAAAKKKVQNPPQPEQSQEQPLPSKEKQPSIELPLPLNQNTSSSVETEVEKQLPLQQEELVQPTPERKLLGIELQKEEEQSRAKEKNTAALACNDTGVPSSTEEDLPSVSLDKTKTYPLQQSHHAITDSVKENYSTARLPEEEALGSTPEETLQHQSEVSTPAQADGFLTPNTLPLTLEHLPSVITNYMLVTNSPRIKGRELSASLHENILTVYRHQDDTPVMQTRYVEGNWYEEKPTRLNENEIEQIESLRTFTQQALINKSQSKGGIEQ